MGPIKEEYLKYAENALKAGTMNITTILNVIATAMILDKPVLEIQDKYMDAMHTVNESLHKIQFPPT